MTDILRVAWQGTTRRRLRSWLTAVSLMLGVLTLVVVQSAQAMIHQATLQRAILQNGQPATVRLSLDAVTAAEQQWWLDRLRHTQTALYNTYPAMSITSGHDQSVSADLIAVGAGLRSIRPLRILAGSWFTGPTLAPQLVVNRSAALALSPLDGEYRLGEALRVSVIGIADDGNESPTAYVADEVSLERAGWHPVTRSILVTGNDLDVASLAERMRTLARIGGHQGEIGDVSRVDTVGEFEAQLATQRRLFLAIALLCLMVGSLGILNIGLSALRERAEELSLRRALGASRPAIAAIMMLESQIVAFGAALAAVALAHLAAPWFLTRMTTMDLGRPGLALSAIGWGILASALAALAGALAPSIRAARVPIANLLR